MKKNFNNYQLPIRQYMMSAESPEKKKVKEKKKDNKKSIDLGLDWDDDQVESHTLPKFYEQFQLTVRIKCN